MTGERNPHLFTQLQDKRHCGQNGPAHRAYSSYHIYGEGVVPKAIGVAEEITQRFPVT
jgi:hypothetical protein